MKIKHGYNQDSIQDMNRTLLINLLRKEGICARAHLAKLSKLKQATVTNIVNDFINWGIVKEVGFLVGDKGRRSIGISINNDDYGVVGIRIARKDYTVGIFNLSGEMVQYHRVDIDVTQLPRVTFSSIIQDVDMLINKVSDRKILSIGIAIPGPYSEKRGRIELMTGVLGWNEIYIKKEMEDTFSIPVFIEQDANAGALAQYWYREEPEQDTRVLVYVAAGQGVGAGIVCNGQLLKGAIGVAGEIGHTSINFQGPKCSCGNYGCLENYCSSISFTREVNKKLKLENELTFSQAKELVNKKNDIAMNIFLQSCDYLSVGIINLINSFNPDVIIIGDEMSHIEPETMLKRVDENVKSRILPEIYANVSITMSVVKKDSMVHGAAIAAIIDIFNNPIEYFHIDN